MTELAIELQTLSKLIADRRAGKQINPSTFASMLFFDDRELETRAKVVNLNNNTDTRKQHIQTYVDRSLQVIDELLGMGLNAEQALFWFQCARLSDLQDASPQSALATKSPEHVIRSLARVFVEQRQTLAPLWEQMRKDTLSVQESVFRDVKMLSVGAVAGLCGVEEDELSALDLARRLAAKGTMFYITQRGEPKFPAYQFGPRGPKPIVAEILAILSPVRSCWDIAMWFWGGNGWLHGKSPEDCLDTRPNVVLHAARQDVAEEE